jgi:hypothetical protein
MVQCKNLRLQAATSRIQGSAERRVKGGFLCPGLSAMHAAAAIKEDVKWMIARHWRSVPNDTTSE